MSSFIEKMAVLYQAVPSKLLVSIRLAQAVVESSYGNSELARNANNYAGIKASPPWTGKVYNKDSQEERQGVLKFENSDFRKYDTIEDFVIDHSNFCESTEARKRIYANVLSTRDYKAQAYGLTGTYATDSTYGRKLIDVIERYNLTQYDKEDDVMAITKPKIIDRTKQALGYPSTGYYPKRPLSQIKQIVWHYTWSDHDGTAVDVIKLHEHFWKTHYGWDIGGYGFYIGKRGDIVMNYPLTTVTYGAGQLNPQLVHVCCEGKGNYTPAQIKAREELTLWLMYTLNISADNVKGHKEIPHNSTSCPGYTGTRLNQFRSDLKVKYDKLLKGTNTITNSRFVDLPDYKAPAKPFDELKVGDKVTIRENMKAWYNPQDKEGIKVSKDFTGDKDEIIRVMNVNVGYSKRAYLLKGKVSWILEQDLVEARQSWNPIPVQTDNTDKGIKEPMPKDNYAYIEGAYYDLVKRK
ncbi:glucosaminidase domain-containing protein [Globicatella sanguinis]